MSRRHRSILLSLLIVSAFLGIIVVVPDQVAAARFSEAFTGETVGELPTGWTEVNPGDGIAVVNDTQGSPFTPSLRVTHTADGWEVWSPGVDTSGMGAFSFGWRMRSTVPGGPLMQIGMGLARSYLAGGSVAVGILGTGDIYNSGAGCPSDSGYDAVLNIWYEFRMEFSSGGPGTYDLFMNNTGTYTEFTEIASDCAFTALTDAGNTGYFFGLLDGGGAGFFDALDWSVPVVTAPSDEPNFCTGDDYTGTATSDADAATWSISGQHGALSIDSTGIISGDVGDTTGVFTITVTSTSSAGAGSSTFDITIRTCGGVWIRPGDDLASFEPILCEPGALTMTFEDKTADPSTVILYVWDFGDGSHVTTSTNPVVTHTFPESGTYIVNYAVILSDGTIYRLTTEVDAGICKSEVSDFWWDILLGIIAMAIVLWLTWVFTRSRKLMMLALLLTFMAVGMWTVLLSF